MWNLVGFLFSSYFLLLINISLYSLYGRSSLYSPQSTQWLLCPNKTSARAKLQLHSFPLDKSPLLCLWELSDQMPTLRSSALRVLFIKIWPLKASKCLWSCEEIVASQNCCFCLHSSTDLQSLCKSAGALMIKLLFWWLLPARVNFKPLLTSFSYSSQQNANVLGSELWCLRCKFPFLFFEDVTNTETWDEHKMLRVETSQL